MSEHEERDEPRVGEAVDGLYSDAMRVVWVSIDRIARYQNNPRRNEKAVTKVRQSIETFGWRQPIVVDAEGVIIAGDTRYLAAVELGLPAVPVHYARDLSAELVRAYRIADNKTSEEAEWDDPKLTAELNALLEADVDLSITGMDQRELDKLLDDVDAPTLREVEPVPLPSMTWVLVGIPTPRFIEIAEEVERISVVPDIFCELTANGDDAAAAHRKIAKRGGA